VAYRIEAFDPGLHETNDFRCGSDSQDNVLRRTAKRQQCDGYTRLYVATDAAQLGAGRSCSAPAPGWMPIWWRAWPWPRASLSNKQIAQEAEIATTTARDYVSRLCRRLGAAYRTQELTRAIALGMVEHRD
jgi:hypothetical protein